MGRMSTLICTPATQLFPPEPAKDRAVFFPVSVGAHARAEVRLCRAHGRRLRRLRLSQRRQIGPRLCGRRHLLFQRQLRKCMRLNRLQFGCLQVRRSHRLAQLRPTPVPGRPGRQSIPLCARPRSPGPTSGPTPPQGRPSRAPPLKLSSAAAVSCSCWATSISRCA